MIGSLVDRGLPSDQALQQVLARLKARATDAELEILTVLWSRGPSTVREVHEIVSLRKPTQYTTVLKLIQIMTAKGLVRRDEKQRAHVCEAARPREWTQRQIAGDSEIRRCA